MESEIALKSLCNMRGSLFSPCLERWKSRIRALIPEFHSVAISHIYRAQNGEADRLSNAGCSSATDSWISFQSFDTGIPQEVSQIQI